MRRFLLLTLSLCLILTCALLIFRAGAVERAAWWESLMDCEQPCWGGVQPGRTTVADAGSIFTETLSLLVSPRYYRTPPSAMYQYNLGRVFIPDAVILPALYIYPQTPFTLGEFVLKFGPPERVQVVSVRSFRDCSANGVRCSVFTLLYPQLGINLITQPAPDRILRPALNIATLTLSRDAEFLALETGKWRGFGAAGLYLP